MDRLDYEQMPLSTLGKGGRTPDFARHPHQGLGPKEAYEARVFPLSSCHAQIVCSSQAVV